MSEANVVDSGSIYTQSDLLKHMRKLGVQEGDCLCVHTSMSRMGWICGCEQAIVEALLEAVGSSGTLVMPAQSGFNSERFLPVGQLMEQRGIVQQGRIGDADSKLFFAKDAVDATVQYLGTA